MTDLILKALFLRLVGGAAVADGMSTAALSFFVDGTGSAKMYKTIANSRVGHIALDIVQAMSVNIFSQIETGNGINFEESFFNALLSVTVSNFGSKKTNELLGFLKDSNKSYNYAANKLQRNIKAGKNKKRILHDKTRVSIKRGNALRATHKYVKRTTSNRMKGEAVTKLTNRAKNEMNNEEKDKE